MFKNLLISLFLTIAVMLISPHCFAIDASSPIKTFHLPNGQTVVIKEDHSSPIVTIDTWVKTGSMNENPQNNGVSHFLEHLFFKGTKAHIFGETERILEAKGAVYNAATSKDFTHFYTTIASQKAETALDLQADMLLNAAIPPDELKKERKVVIQEISRSYDNPHSVVFENLNGILFKHHPYKYTTLGPASNIENISREEIFKYYHKWYIPANMITVIVGDINTDKMLKLVEEKYKNNSNQPSHLKTNYQKEPYLQKSTEVVKKGKYNTGYLEIGFRGVPAKSIKENCALDLIGSILGDGASSRLYQNIKEKQNLVTSISAGNYSLKDDSILFIDAELEPQNYVLAKKAIMNEIKRLSDGKVSDSELNKAKTQMAISRTYESESTEDIANSIGYSMTIGENIESYTKYIDNINKITTQDIQNIARKYLLDSRAAISALMPENTNAASIVKSQETYKSVTKSVMDNGMTVITNKNDSNNVISLSLFVKGGDLIDPVPGMLNVIAGTLTKGTASKSAYEISETLDKSGIIIAPSANSDYFEIQLKSTKANFDKAFDLLVDIVKNPAFNNEYIEKTKNDIIQGVKQTKDSPLSYAMNNFNKAIFPDHPYGNVGEVVEKNLPNINRENIVDFYQKTFIPANMIVSISGNVSPVEIEEKFYSAFPQREGNIVNLSKFPTQFTPLKTGKMAAVTQDTKAAWIILGWRVGGITQDKEFATLKVINSVLGDGLSSRLFVEMRKKQGLAYNVSSSYPSRIDNSSFFLYIGTQPENAKLVRDNFLQEIYKIKTELLSDTELSEVKQKITGKFALSQETNLQKAHNYGAFETIGKGYKYNYSFPELINSVTAQDIITVANKYFNNPYAVSIVAPKESIDQISR